MMPALAYLTPSLNWGSSACAALVSCTGSAVGVGRRVTLCGNRVRRPPPPRSGSVSKGETDANAVSSFATWPWRTRRVAARWA
jgi:hypothetical protein